MTNKLINEYVKNERIVFIIDFIVKLKYNRIYEIRNGYPQ